MDDDLDNMSREDLIAEVRRLRAGIREHRDSTGHDLCWHHPKLWSLLPEALDPTIAVPVAEVPARLRGLSGVAGSAAARCADRRR